MTRKITLGVILILILFIDYEIFFGNTTFIREKVASVSELESANKQLKTKATQLEKLSTDDFDTQKEKLQKTIEEYKTKKSEYEEIVEQYTVQENAAEELIQLEESEIKDIYDVDFLWTIVGNYATEEGINLKFDINKNTSLLSSTNTDNDTYVVCDLKFTITGSYINLTDFIYDLEDDDRLTFEINNFDMQKDGQDLRVTLTVKEVKVNSNNLIDTNVASNAVNKFTDTTSSVQNVNSSTSKSTSSPVDAITNSIPNTTSTTGGTSDIQAAMQDAAATSN